MIPIITLLVVLLFSLIITRIGTIALTHTGLSFESARFQARSAFTGVGFTTAESEQVVNHPVRRRILLQLMLLGNVGIATTGATLILTFITIKEADRTATLWKLVFLLSGVLALWGLTRSKWIDGKLSVAINYALKNYTRLDVRDYENLLQLKGGYGVSELFVEHQDWISNRTLGDCELRREGVNVLGIQRSDGAYEGSPNGDTLVEPGDTLILYGRNAVLENLDQRMKGWVGDVQHHELAAEQERQHEEELLASGRITVPEGEGPEPEK